LPFPAEDFASWPIELAELAPFMPDVEHLFQLPAGPYEATRAEAALGGGSSADFRVRAAKWPSFQRRNVALLLARPLEAGDGPQVWLNATVTRLGLDESGRVREIEARGGSNILSVRAREVVLAAGAIESTRLLLQLDAASGRSIVDGHGLLGRHFHDHLSAPVARIAAPNRPALEKLAGFRFEGSGMRNVRFELNRARRDRALPGAFAHVVWNADTPGGFDALRDIYRSVQRRTLPRGGDLARLARNSSWLLRAAWARASDGRVLPPDGAKCELHLVTEQIPVAENRITLSERDRDAFGLPLARIDWRVGDADIANTAAVLRVLSNYWDGAPRALFGALEALPRDRWEAALSDGGGIFHPGGSARMGHSAANGIVDRDLRVFGVPNLRVLSTAVFPTGGSANPTMMLILMAFRCARQLR
ncbi:MAG: hypothetical protein H7Y89_06565, partial [Steroidobacteraceae bacterium]|nr:hypothetical protein [Steroidobacteraceae bacterium]